MPKAMLKKFRIGSTQKIMLKCPPISLFRLIGGHFFAKIAKIAVTFTVEILLCG